jgi:hypothetical protein
MVSKYRAFFCFAGGVAQKKAKFTGLTAHPRNFLPDGVAVRPVSG